MRENKKIYLMAIISKISIIGIGLVTSALVNRKLGVDLKGQYAYITNIVSLLVIIVSFGIGQTYSTYRRKYGPDILQNFIFLTIIQALIPIICCLILLMFKENVDKNVYIILILTSGGVVRTNITYLAAIEDIKKRDFNNIIYKIIYLVLVMLLYISSIKSIEMMLLITLADELIISIGTFITYKFKPKMMKIEKKFLKDIYKLGFYCMIMHLLMTLNYNLDIIFLKKMTSTTYVGLYSVGVTLANMLWLLPDAFKDVLVSKTARVDSIKEIVIVTKYSMFFSIFLIIGFVIFGKIFIKIMYGDEFIESYFCTIILFIGCLSMIIYKLIHPIYISKGQQNVIVKILCLSVITNVIINIILIPKFNMYGAAIASVFSYSICSVMFLYKFCKEYNVKIKDFFIIRKSEIIQMLKRK